jgi:VWFA-related protein
MSLRPVLVWVCLATACHGAPPSNQEPTLSTTVRLVIAPATVTGPDGRYVDGLTEKDFLVLDNGNPQRIQADVTFVPISLVVAVQANILAAEALNKVHRIGPMLEPLILGERGEAAVLSYDDEISLALGFTSDSGRIAAALKRIPPSGQRARMIDAAIQGVRMLAAQPANRRRVLLLIGETRDRSSKAKLQDAVTLAQQENVSIYVLSYSAFLTPFTAKPGAIPTSGDFNLLAVFYEIARLATTNAAEAFSKYTGGGHLSFLKQKGLEQAISRIGEELHSQYLLSFISSASPGDQFHSIQVTVKNRPDVVVRTRPGYWLSAPSQN